MEMQVTINEREAVVALEGEAQVDESRVIAEEFKKLSKIDKPIISIDLLGLTVIDITFIQLLYSLSNTLMNEGKHLMVFQLPREHCVLQRSSLSGIKFEYHFTMAERTG